jgi:putative metallohydrolase (TIGR04338 family)
LLRTSASPHAPTLVRERRPRDSQRSKLYRAERTVGAGHHFPSVAHCQAQVDRILASAWWKARFPALDQVQVRDGRGRRHAGAHQSHGAISLPRWSRRERIILHELAHLATPASFAAHGPEYAMVYLELVGHFMGATAARDLAEAFRAHRVRWMGQ